MNTAELQAQLTQAKRDALRASYHSGTSEEYMATFLPARRQVLELEAQLRAAKRTARAHPEAQEQV